MPISSYGITPGYIVLKGGFIPAGGPDNFNNGYLPAVYQGSIFRDTQAPVPNLEPPEPHQLRQRERMDLLRELDRASADRYGHDDRVDAAIANYEMAFQMQTTVPELLDIAGEWAWGQYGENGFVGYVPLTSLQEP